MARRDFPGNGEVQNSCGIIKARVDRAREYFSRPEVREDILLVCEEVLLWFEANEEKYDAQGSRLLEPLWQPFAQTDDEIVLHSRRYGIQCRIWEQGLRRLIGLLIEKKHIDRMHWKFLRRGLSYRTMPFHFEQIALNRVGKDGVSLADLALRFDYANSYKLRNAMLAPMAELGLWKVRENGGWDIAMGEVAIVFHEKVYMPTFREKINSACEGE